jgi:hypothetical protein
MAGRTGKLFLVFFEKPKSPEKLFLHFCFFEVVYDSCIGCPERVETQVLRLYRFFI